MGKKLSIMEKVFELKKKCSVLDQQLMKDLNLSQSELQFFTALKNCHSICSNELSKHMELSASRVSRVVDKLVNNGYLLREIDTKDRRAITLTLTEKGVETQKHIEKGRRECEARILEVLPKEDLEKFRHIVDQIITRI